MTRIHRNVFLTTIFIIGFLFTTHVDMASAQTSRCCCDTETGECRNQPRTRSTRTYDDCEDHENQQLWTDGLSCREHNSRSEEGLSTTGGGTITSIPCNTWVCNILGRRHLIPDGCLVGNQAPVCATNKKISCGHNTLTGKFQCPSGGPCVESCGINEVLLLFTNIKDLMLGVLGSFALLMFVFGGVMFLTSGGNQDRVTQGKTILRNAVIGLILVFVSWIIVNFILTALTGGKIGETGKIFEQTINRPPDSEFGDNQI